LNIGTYALLNVADGFQALLPYAVAILLIVTGAGETEKGLQKVCTELLLTAAMSSLRFHAFLPYFSFLL
jgi:hypothetical protein